MQAETHIPKTRPPAILLLAVILAAVAALSLHTGSATYAQTDAPDRLPAPALTATATGPDTIELVWTIVPDAASYRLVVWDETINDWRDIGGVVTGTSYVHGELTADTTYYFHIHAVAADGAMSKWSSQASATTLAPGASTVTPTPTPTASSQTATTATPTPTPTRAAGSELAAPALTAAGGAGEITLRWDAVAQAASYRLVVWDETIKDWRDIGGVLTGTSYVHRGLTADTTYYFHILALAADGAMSKWSSQAAATTLASASTATPTVTPTPTASSQTATTATPTPTTDAGQGPPPNDDELIAPALTAEGGFGKITLRWSVVLPAASYRLVVWDETIKDWRGIGGLLTGTSYVHRGLTAGATYYFHIRAVAADGAMSKWSSQASATVSVPATTERGALIALYEATDGKNWELNANWLSDKPLDSWHGVSTDPNGRVTALHLHDNDLSGEIPDLSALSNLTTLNLFSNELSGPIPDLSALLDLEILDLGNNDLSGEIPDLSALSNLTTLYLHDNELSGSIPDLSALSNLESLELQSNQLTGAIPDLSALSNLESLELQSNQLTGAIPDLSALSNLESLELQSNDLSGEIPDLSALSNLRWLYLHDNDLTGAIPDLSALSNLRWLYLHDNDLTGAIPDLSALSNLQRLHLDDNQLSGPIPDMNSLMELEFLGFGHNQLSGPVPDLSSLALLKELHLNNNRLSGAIFNLNLLPSLRTLDLSHNQLSGPLPELGPLASLTCLDLSGNRFCLPAGYAPFGTNAVVTAYLNGLNLAPCTEAELAAVPGAPQNLATAIGGNQVTLTWDAVPDAAGYELWVWNSLDREWEAAGGTLTATTYTHSVLSDGRNYYYQVRTRFANGVRSPWSQRARAIIVPGRYPPPPPSLGLHLYYQKYLEVDKVVIVAPTEVSDETMEQARAIVSGMLSGNAGLLLENSSGKYIRISIYKQDEQGRLYSQVPEFLNKYVGGLAVRIPSGWIVVVPQENRRCGVFIREFAKAIQYVIEDRPGGAEFESRLDALYEAALAAGLWQGQYASLASWEYWAETVRYWFQGKVPDSLVESPTKLADYDPEIARLIAEVFGDASVPEACQVPPSEEHPGSSLPPLFSSLNDADVI